MIKIIEDGNLDTMKFVHKCEDCDTVFSYQYSDTNKYQCSVLCPTCNIECTINFVPWSCKMMPDRPINFVVVEAFEFPEVGESWTIYVTKRFPNSLEQIWTEWIYSDGKWIEIAANGELSAELLYDLWDD